MAILYGFVFGKQMLVGEKVMAKFKKKEKENIWLD